MFLSETEQMGNEGVRARFPALAASPQVSYLDSASTTQKPDTVIDVVRGYHAEHTANPGRGSHPWSTSLTKRLVDVRERFAAFVGAEHADEIVFTPGATAAVNAVAMAWGVANLCDGDEILYSPSDHESNVYPWVHLRQLLTRFGVEITLVPYTDVDDILTKTTARTRLITACHLHGVFGSLTTLEALQGRVADSVLTCLDCSQSAGHVPVDVTALGVDFAVFSAHKMFGAPGTGVLYCARRVHDLLTPFLPGGTSAGAMPGRLEGGTSNVPGILALGAAVEFVDDVGLDAIAAHDRELTRRLVDGLAAVPGVDFLAGYDVGYGIVTFTLDGVTGSDFGFVSSERGYYVRTGTQCIPDGSVGADSVRVSVHVYNTADEVDGFVDLVGAAAKGDL